MLLIQKNSFLISYFRDAEPVSDPGYENYNLSIPSDVQYDSNANGWNGSYIPGNAWTSNGSPIDKHQNIWFHLTPYTAPNSITDISSANIKLYPNPAKDIINIVLSDPENVRNIKITDIAGRIVDKRIIKKSDSLEINTSNYTPGIYFFEINGITTTEILKFTKIN